MAGSTASLEAGQRVTFRGLRWVVEAPSDQVVTLVGDDRLNRDRRMQVLRDLEPIEPAELPPLVPRIGETGWSMREWHALHDAYRLTLAHGWGFLGGVSWGRLVVEPYQLVPLRRLEGLADPRLLIADDTGLGKTAEAGIILTRLLQRRQADRVLILSKAHPDPERWCDELSEKFGLDFVPIANGGDYARLRRRIPSHLNVFATEPRLVASMSWAAQKHVIDELAKVPKWDVVIIDEAHHVAARGSQGKRLTTLARLVAERADALLLLTATPHDGKQESFASLIDLVDPFAIVDPANIEPDAVRPLMVRRLKPWVVRADGTRFARREIEVIAVDDVADDLRTPAERGLARSLRGYAAQLRAAAKELARADDRQRAFAVGFLDSLLRKRLSSSIPALAETLEVVLRNLDGREADPSDLEDRERGEGLSGLPDELPDGRRHRALVEDLLRRARAIPPRDGAKTRAVVRLLERIVRRDCEKVVVFTEYYDTLDHLVGVLADEGYPEETVLTFHGATRDRERVIDRFRDDPTATILLATDAASEAVNLQRSCHHLVHMEVPWNPNRYEQRNGRIDRYGQAMTPKVILLVARRTAEERAAEIVLTKLERIAEDVGSVANVAPLDAARSLEDYLSQGLEDDEGDTEDAGDIGERIGQERADRLDEELAAERGGLLEIVRGERFDEGLLGEITRELELVESTAPGPDQVRSFLDLFLVREGSQYRVEDTGEAGIVSLRIPPRLRSLVGGDRIARGTFRRDIAVREADRPREARAVFLSPGHPLVGAALRDARGWAHRPDFPSRVGYRLVEARASTGVVLTYAVRFVDGRGETLEERFEAVRVDIDGTVIATGDAAEEALREEGTLPAGMPDAARAALDLMAAGWGALLQAGRAAGEARAQQRRTDLAESQSALATAAEMRLLAWTRAREQRIAESFGGEMAQLEIDDVADPVRRMAQGRRDAERARVAQRVRERGDELAALRRVRVESIDEIGALCLLPGEGAA